MLASCGVVRLSCNADEVSGRMVDKVADNVVDRVGG